MARVNDYGIPGDNQYSPFRDSSVESAWKATQNALGQGTTSGSSAAVEAKPVATATSGLTSTQNTDIKTGTGVAGTGSTAGTGTVRSFRSAVTPNGDIAADDGSADAANAAYANSNLSSAINALYRTYYGRDATTDELSTHISNINRGRGNIGNIQADLIADAQRLKLGPYAESTAASTGTTTSSTTAGPTNGDWRSWFMNLVGTTTPSVESIKQLWPTLEQMGVKFLTNTGTTGIENWNGDLMFPDGTTIDVAHGNGTGGWDRWQWLNTANETAKKASAGTSSGLSSDYAAQLQSIIKNLLSTVFASDTATGSLPTELQALYNQILSNPESMSADTVSAMKEAQKENLLATRQALLDQGAQSAASRGMYNSGWVDQNALTANDAFTSDLTKAYRDIDIEAAKTNSADRIAALNAAAPLYEYSSSLPLNWYTALQNALLGNYNYGLNLASLQEQMQEYLGNYLNSSTE